MSVSKKFGKLKPKTTYYYRAYATINGNLYTGPMYAVVTVSDVPQQLVLSETSINVGIGQTAEIMWAQLPVGSTDKGYMHEGFNADDATAFTRPWFAWSNSIFAEFIESALDKGII